MFYTGIADGGKEVLWNFVGELGFSWKKASRQ